MKKYLSLLLTLALIFSLAGPAQTASAATIKINKTKATMEVDSTLKLSVTGTKNKVAWKTSKSSVAAVSSSGLITAKKEGSATITATVSSKKYICVVTVVNSNKVTAGNLSSLTDIVTKLKDEGLLSGKETKMDASMIGGVNGVKYADSKVELYEFDTDSTAYKTLVKTNKVKLEAFNVELSASAINGKFVLFCNDSANKDQIIKIFKNLDIE